ncbi:MAG: Uncharacterized MFS-type transporter, partial [uncultured Acidimicrobiales bacterium]
EAARPRHAATHLPLPRQPQLPHLHRRAGDLAQRDLDAERGPGLARAAPHRQRHRPRARDRAPVPPRPAVRPLRRGHRRPLPQAPVAPRHPDRGHDPGAGARSPRHHRDGRALDGVRHGGGVRPRHRRRQPGPADLRARDGRSRQPDQRDHAELGCRQRCPGRRPRPRRRPHRRRRHRDLLRAERLQLRRRDPRPPPDADGGPEPGAHPGAGQGPAAGGLQVRAQDPRPAHPAAHDGDHRDALLRVPGDPPPRRRADLRRWCRHLRHAHLGDGRRRGGRGAGDRRPLRGPEPHGPRPGRRTVRLGDPARRPRPVPLARGRRARARGRRQHQRPRHRQHDAAAARRTRAAGPGDGAVGGGVPRHDARGRADHRLHRRARRTPGRTRRRRERRARRSRGRLVVPRATGRRAQRRRSGGGRRPARGRRRTGRPL